MNFYPNTGKGKRLNTYALSLEDIANRLALKQGGNEGKTALRLLLAAAAQVPGIDEKLIPALKALHDLTYQSYDPETPEDKADRAQDLRAMARGLAGPMADIFRELDEMGARSVEGYDAYDMLATMEEIMDPEPPNYWADDHGDFCERDRT